ncbi:MAG TPA: hypothetical protein VK253_00570 [Candidatus Binatia bacterium]|nr:hypothetical protein [Candidatus Binatia bacterium]
MRKAVLVTAILLTILLAEPMVQVLTVNANFITVPVITIQTPAEYNRRIYQNTTVDLEIDVRTPIQSSDIIAISYSIDGSANNTLGFKSGGLDYSATGTLVNLADGYHFLKVYAIDAQGKTTSEDRLFAVNTTFRYPNLIISPQNASYSSNEVPLIYNISEQVTYAYYALDNSTNITLKGNATLTGLSEGQHRITVTATTDIYGSLYSQQTAYFTVDSTKKEQTSDNATLTTIIAITLGILAVGSALAVVTYRKRKDTK